MLPVATLETLDNGLKLVLVPDDHVESLCFGLFVASGSRHEGPADAGISHFIEHMLFKGTKRRTALEISQAIEGRGGHFNAYTSEEGTCFYAYLPHHHRHVPARRDSRRGVRARASGDPRGDQDVRGRAGRGGVREPLARPLPEQPARPADRGFRRDARQDDAQGSARLHPQGVCAVRHHGCCGGAVRAGCGARARGEGV